MIMTVTLNTAIDKLYLVDELLPFEVSRVREVVNTAGGKGMNVSRVAALSGEEVTAMGFAGGCTGQFFRSLIREPGIRPAFTATAGETRSCINIRDKKTNRSTEFLEPGCPVTEQELAAFFSDFRRELPGADVVAISGSMPAGVPSDCYARLVREARALGKPVLVDTSGAALRETIPAGPSLIKPNTDELAQLTDADVSSLESCVAAARQLRAAGAENVAVSLGKDGVLVVSGEGVFRGLTPDVPVVNTVGCGDSMVAGFAVSLARKKPLEEAIRFAVAVSTANALTKETGFYRQEDLLRLLPEIRVERIASA